MEENPIGTVTFNALQAATVIVALLKDDRSIHAVKFIKEWCTTPDHQPTLRTAVNMMRSFRDMGGSTSERIDKIEAALPLGRIAQVV